MAPTVVGLFDTRAAAESAVQDLVNNGVPREDISLVSSDTGGEHGQQATGEAAGAGALGGGVLGGVLGLLAGVGALAIPGIGPVLAVGPLVAALGSAGAGALVGAGIGAVSGGLLGALIGAGVPEERAHAYAEGVRRGGTLVATTTDAILGSAVYDILQQHGAVDIEARISDWRRTGWERFDPNAAPYSRSWQETSQAAEPTRGYTSGLGGDRGARDLPGDVSDERERHV